MNKKKTFTYTNTLHIHKLPTRGWFSIALIQQSKEDTSFVHAEFISIGK